MATKRDYYDVLGVVRDANQDDVRRAFRRLARQFHPDVNKEDGAEGRFREINEAYEVLSDPDKRRLYDQFGHAGAQAQGFPGGAAGFGAYGFEDIFDTFETLFGGRTRAGGTRRPQRGSHFRLNMELSFEEALFGCERDVEIPRAVTCERCTGRGTEPGTEPVRCPQCNGSGESRRVQQSIFGQFVNVTACERCRGEGQVIVTPCSNCQGRGEVRAVRKLVVTVPPGVDEGQEIRLTGEGAPGQRGGPPGDLYVVLSVKPHPQFKRETNDLIYEHTIDVASAALGSEVEIPTLDADKKTVSLKIPPGTQHGRILRVKGMGVPYLRSYGRGDLRVVVKVAVPQNLNDEQRRLFQQLAETFETARSEKRSAQDGREGRGIFEKVKEFFDGDA
jgi:molecular chaperone DnaJ